MLSKETFCEALRKIQAQKDRDEQFSKALTLMGDGHFVFEGGAPLLAALLDVLKEAVNDQYDYISWWLYCRVDGASTESNRLAINQQLTALRSLAGQLGFSISAEMLQYESGLDANRQSIRTLIRDARHGVYDRVLVMNGDRLARDAEGLAAI